LFFVLILWFAADFAVPFEPGPTRFVLEDMEEALAAPRTSVRARGSSAVPSPAPPRVAPRTAAPARPVRVTSNTARREWRTPPPIRAVSLTDRPASLDAH